MARLTWDEIKSGGHGSKNAQQAGPKETALMRGIADRLPIGCSFFIMIANDITNDAVLISSAEDMPPERVKLIAQSIVASVED